MFLWIVAFLLGVSCAPNLVPPSGRVQRDDRPLPVQPKVRDPSLANEILEMTFGYQMWQVFDTPRLARKLAGHPYQACNVDRFDEVPDNSWFTNRNGRRPLSLGEILIGSFLNTTDNGFSYSINQSAKEVPHVPTTRDEQYKAKAFIDMFI